MSSALDRDRWMNVSPAWRLAALGLVVVAAFGSDAVAQDQPEASFAPAKSTSNAADPTTDDTATDDSEPTQEPTLSFSFRFAPWETVLTKFAAVADLSLDVTELPPDTFNYYDKAVYTPREALDVLNGYLLQRGFVLIRRDRFLVCVNLEKGIPANLIPLVTVDQLPEYGKNEMVSVILTHEDLDVAAATTQIQQLQGAHGNVVSLNSTRSLLVTDTADNVRLLQRLLEQGAFSRPTTAGSAPSGPAFKSFALEHVSAGDAERLIRSLFNLPTASATAERATPPQTTDVSIISDPRSNRLFVTATSSRLSSIEQVITAYDVAVAGDDPTTRPVTTTTRIVPLPGADVILIGQALDSLSPRIRVSTTPARAAAEAGENGEARPAAAQSRQEPSQPTTPDQKTSDQSPDGRDR